MSMIFMDSFDKYGGTIAYMLDGLWSDVPFSHLVNTPAPPHGTWVLDFTQDGAANARIPVPTVGKKFGTGGRYYWPNLPASNNFQTQIASFRDITNAKLATAWIATTGAIIVTDQGGNVLGQTAGPVVTANAWQHIECYVEIHASAGVFKIAVNGATKLSLTGLVYSAVADIAQLEFGRIGGGGGAGYYFKDFYYYNDAGARNNTFPIGDIQVLMLPIDGNGAFTDWTASTPPAWSCINETPPNDATYISHDATGLPKESSFTFANLPAGATGVKAVQVTGRQWKSDAGTSTQKNGVISNSVQGYGADRPVSTAPTYYWDVFETDPNTSAVWGVAAVNAAEVSVTRTT